VILVFGKTGQVARELSRAAPDAIFLGRDVADLTDAGTCAEQITSHAPRAVINAAAYTAVDNAESDVETAHLVNATAPAAMAKACADLNIPFVHISTDYVFDGKGETSFSPDHPTAPLGIYGQTKLAGEEAIRDVGTSVILRTSWVFSAHGDNFVKSMLRFGAERDEMGIVADQIGGPTPAAAIADAVLTIARAHIGSDTPGGTHHFAGAPDVSWADFAREIFRQADLSVNVTDIPTSDYPTPATRPLNSRLNCDSLETTYGISRPDWRRSLTQVLQELTQ